MLFWPCLFSLALLYACLVYSSSALVGYLHSIYQSTILSFYCLCQYHTSLFQFVIEKAKFDVIFIKTINVIPVYYCFYKYMDWYWKVCATCLVPEVFCLTAEGL